MKAGIVFFVKGFLVGLSIANGASAGACSAREATFAEENIQNVKTWTEFSTFYARHKKCDVDALRYAFTQQVAQLTSNDKGMANLSKMLAKDATLKSVILWHLKSETIASTDRDQIRQALQTCKAEHKNICREIKKAIAYK